MNKILKNGFINFLSLLVPSVLMIVSMPLLTRWLGIEKFGLWLLCSTLLGLFGLLDFGLKETAITFIPQLLARNDNEGLESHIRSLFSLNLLIASCATIILFLVARYAALDIFNVSQKNADDTVLAFRILAAGIVPSLAINILSAIAMGFQRFNLSTALIVGRNIVTTLGTLLLAALTGRLAPIIIFSVCVSWFFLVIGTVGLHRAVSVKKLFKFPTINDFRDVLSFGSLTFITNLSLLAMGVFDKILIGALLGPMSVAYYSVPLSLVAKLEQVLVKFAQALFPRFSEVAVQNNSNPEKRNKIYDLSFSATMLIGIGFGAGLIVISNPLLTIWMGAEFAEKSVWILRGLAVGHMFKMFNVIPSYMIYSMRKPIKNSIAYSTSGILYVLLIALFAKHVSLGLLSFTSSVYAVSFIILYLSVKDVLSKTLKWHAIPFVLASLIASGLSYKLMDMLQLVNIISVFFAGTFFSIAYIGSSYIITMYLLPKDGHDKHNSLIAISKKLLVNFN